MKNRKNKKINKKIFKNISFYSDFNSFYLNNTDYFLTVNDIDIANGIDIVKNIIISSKKVEKNQKSIEKFIKSLQKDKNLKGSYIAQTNLDNTEYFIDSSDKITIINFLNTNLNIRNISDSLQVNVSKNGFNNIKLDLGQVIIINKILSPKKLIKYYKIAIETKIKYFEYLKLPEHIKNIVNDNEFLVLVSNIPENMVIGDDNNVSCVFNQDFKEITFNNYSKDDDQTKYLEDIEKELVKCVIKSCNKCLKKSNISFGILDYVIAEGISIDDLVDAGMELCVEVEDTEELRNKLKNQLLKSLEDLNIIALLMAAIRCEDDFQSNRLREVDVSDDPAYLYTDEVLGIAIANQIAGTKAIFNFKRYDETKPGIIAKLGPMVDDIFAGLVAGCMSKIFEDYY